MRTLLRHVSTGLYVRCADQWTGDPDEAHDFKTMSEAIRFVEQSGLSKMELAFVSTPPAQCTEVPLELLGWGASVSRGYRHAA